MKKTVLILALLAFAGAMSSCKRADIESDLVSSWIEDGGTATVEITKDDFIYNGVSLRVKGYKLYVEDGQVWNEKGDEQIYYYDYKLSGNNLFLQAETTSNWTDPSSPSSAGIKFIKQ